MIWHILHLARKVTGNRWPHWLYMAYLRSDTWKYKRQAVIKRSAGRCEHCGHYCYRPEVHHKTYKHLGAEPLRDLMTLCPDCHRRMHSKGTYKAYPLAL